MRGTSSTTALAVRGGAPVRHSMLPYGLQWLDEDDVNAVVEVLHSDWLTTGPNIPKFEQAFAEYVNAKEAVAVSNGTAALHAAMYAADIGPGDEVIIPALTFVSTANCVVFQGGTPVFADVERDTLLIDPQSIETRLTPKTKAIISVDFAGQPCEYDLLNEMSQQNGLTLVDDACHAIGGSFHENAVGSLADLNTFSFHPVKNITTGEGGMVTTENTDWAKRMRFFRNHGITSDHKQRTDRGSFLYEMTDLGYNYRLSDFQAALGIRQLRKVNKFVLRRREVAAVYDSAFEEILYVTPLSVRPEVCHAYHLYVVQFDTESLGMNQTEIFNALRAENIGVNMHYPVVHLQPFYRNTFGTGPGMCPVAEEASARLLTLPLFPRMDVTDAEDVIEAVRKL